MVKQVQEVESELQVRFLSQPRQMVVFEETGIDLSESGIAVDVALEIALLSGG